MAFRVGLLLALALALGLGACVVDGTTTNVGSAVVRSGQSNLGLT